MAHWVGGDQLGVTAKTATASVFKWTSRFKYYSLSFCLMIPKLGGPCQYFVVYCVSVKSKHDGMAAV